MTPWDLSRSEVWPGGCVVLRVNGSTPGGLCLYRAPRGLNRSLESSHAQRVRHIWRMILILCVTQAHTPTGRVALGNLCANSSRMGFMQRGPSSFSCMVNASNPHLGTNLLGQKAALWPQPRSCRSPPPAALVAKVGTRRAS